MRREIPTKADDQSRLLYRIVKDVDEVWFMCGSRQEPQPQLVQYSEPIHPCAPRTPVKGMQRLLDFSP